MEADIKTKNGTGPVCQVCTHAGRSAVDMFIVDGVVSVDGRSFNSAPPLCRYLEQKYPNEPEIKPYAISRHKTKGHVAALAPVQGGGTVLVLRDKKLYRQNKEGVLEELPHFSPEDALTLIVNVGLDNILKGKVIVGSKALVDALKILTDMKKGRDENDDYERIIAAQARGEVIDVSRSDAEPEPSETPRQLTADEILSVVPRADYPPDLEMPESDNDGDGDD
jgi:hypothetical protein